MDVALTGATGFIGSHILAELQDHGHEVTALVRDAAQADVVSARGAKPHVVDLYDRPAVAAESSACSRRVVVIRHPARAGLVHAGRDSRVWRRSRWSTRPGDAAAVRSRSAARPWPGDRWRPCAAIDVG
jgi:nucleoside-diphosphate-sugar epimerase